MIKSCRSMTALVALSLTLIFSGPTSLANDPPTKAPDGLSLNGRVVDDGNRPVSGVAVQAQGRRPALTDAKGEFTLDGLAPTERLVVTFSKPGLMQTTRVYQANTRAARIGGTGNVVIIWPLARPVTLDAVRGGRVPFRNGGGVTLPPRALVDAQGKPVSGPVRVNLTYLDVTDPRQLRAAPGDFTARMKNGSLALLESFGMFEISVSDLKGQPLQLDKERTARLELPVPRVRRGKAPNATGLFSFDTKSGRWIEEGRLVRDANVYVANLNQLNVAWNSDNTLETTCMTIQVFQPGSPTNQPEPFAHVDVDGVYYSYHFGGTTDANGRICVLVKRCEYVYVTTYSNQNYSWNSGPQVAMSSCTAAGQSDCGNLQTCPLVTSTLSIIVGGERPSQPR